jgi:transposase
MAKTFRPWNVEQRWLLPPSVQELVPKEHLAHFVRETVREDLDLSAVVEVYDEERGFPPYHPVMMTALLLYAYCQGIYSSRRIARACKERVDFMAVTAMNQPDFRTVSDFRKRHLSSLAALFLQVLRLCQKTNMVRLGHVALDGTKLKANASKHKAMSYGRMRESEERLATEIQSWFDRAAAADEAEDREHGADAAGDELPTWVVNKEQRRERIRAAREQLEAEAKASEGPDDDPTPPSPKNKAKTTPKQDGDVKPSDKTQLNFTDPESKIMVSRDGFLQGYNCQAAVDGHAQIIVAHDVVATNADSPQLVGMVDQIKRNLGRHARELSADTGYLSEANLRALRRRRVRGYIATKRTHPGSDKKPRRRRENQGPLSKEMCRRIKRGGHRSRYRLRKQIVEPVFGQIKGGRGFRQFLLRGRAKVSGEWALLCTAHNLVKLAAR